MSTTDMQQKYKEQALSTLTPGELIVRLYDEAAVQISSAIKAIERKDIPSAHKGIIKAQDIFLYLSDSLDMRYPISKNLESLYSFLYSHLVKANVSKDPDALRDALRISNELGDAFRQAEVLCRKPASLRPLGKSI